MPIFERNMDKFVENLEFAIFNKVMNDIRFIVLEHGFLHAGKEWNFKNLSSPFNRIYFIISGSARVKNEFNNIDMISGHAYLIPLNNTYDYVCDSDLNKFYIHFRVELIPGHDLFEGQKEVKLLNASVDKINTLVELASSDRISELIKCKGLLLDFIGNFVSQYPDTFKEKIILADKYIRLYSYVETNCFADLRVKNIAKYLNVPMTNLSKNFKNDTGMTLKKYIDNKIVKKSQELLLTTTLPIKDISYELHFLDEFHFSRFFKNKTGIAPNRYRQRSNTYK